jgi:hypothetical protein
MVLAADTLVGRTNIKMDRLLRTLSLWLLALSATVGCRTSTPTTPSVRPPEITSETEEGSQDLVFALIARSGRTLGGEVLRATGKHQRRLVSFEVRLGPAWKEGNFAGRITYQGTAAIVSVGEESDALVRILDELYGTKLAPRSMNTETSFTAISLEGNPQELKAGAVKLKLFFEAEEEERYAESFLNIDVAKSRVYLLEKDPEYRTPIVLALSLSTKAPPNKALNATGAGAPAR